MSFSGHGAHVTLSLLFCVSPPFLFSKNPNISQIPAFFFSGFPVTSSRLLLRYLLWSSPFRILLFSTAFFFFFCCIFQVVCGFKIFLF